MADLPIFSLALLKGVVEHDDGAAYFGSLGAYTFYCEQARSAGWIDANEKATASGRQIYVRLNLSEIGSGAYGSRAYTWNWDAVSNRWADADFKAGVDDESKDPRE